MQSVGLWRLSEWTGLILLWGQKSRRESHDDNVHGRIRTIDVCEGECGCESRNPSH